MQGFTSNGLASDFFFNNGRINQAVTLGDGNDVFINRNVVSNTIDMGAGVDVFDMAAGTVNGNVSLGSGNDQAFIRDGNITNTVFGQDGQDHVVWMGGEIIGLDTGADTDFAHFIGLTVINLKTGLPVNGGLGSDDLLLWTNTVAGDVARYDNWEQFELTDGSELTFSNFATLTLGDSGTGTGTCPSTKPARYSQATARIRWRRSPAVNSSPSTIGAPSTSRTTIRMPPTGLSSRAIISAMAETSTCRPSSAPTTRLRINWSSTTGRDSARQAFW